MSGLGPQLPPEAVGAAVGVFIYSSICLSLSAVLLWATIAHREWRSYVAMLAFFTGLSTLASMAQQLHTYLRWTSIKLEQFDYVKSNFGNPELSIAGPSVGVDVVFFYAQFYCYNVEAILVVSWATQLAYSIYQLQTTRSAGRYGSNAAKTTAICLPIFQVNLMRTKFLQDNLVAFYFVANIIMGTSLAIGVVLLLAILARYVATQSEVSWHVRYADRSIPDGAGGDASWQSNSLATFTSSTGSVPLHQRNIYDNWLVVRFTIAFVGLAAYQIIIIASEINFALGNDNTASQEAVNLRASNAIRDIKNFIPGVSACILAFVVFGTTKAFRDYFYRRLVPRTLRRKIRNRNSKTSSMTLQLPDRELSTAALRSPGRSPGPSSTAAAGCFAGDDAVSDTGRGRSHELPVLIPTYQAVSGAQRRKDADDEEDIWPGPNAKIQK